MPFILTLLVGVLVGGGLKRADRVAMPGYGSSSSCSMRQRQVMLMPPPPPPPVPSFDNDLFAARDDAFAAKDVTRKAVISYKPEPQYTSAARRNYVTGTIRVRMVLAADGSVRDIVPVTFLPDGLTEQAVEAARNIEFTPASKDGRAVSQNATVEYNFNIY